MNSQTLLGISSLSCWINQYPKLRRESPRLEWEKHPVFFYWFWSLVHFSWHVCLLFWIYSFASISQDFPSPSGLKSPGGPQLSLPLLSLPFPICTVTSCSVVVSGFKCSQVDANRKLKLHDIFRFCGNTCKRNLPSLCWILSKTWGPTEFKGSRKQSPVTEGSTKASQEKKPQPGHGWQGQRTSLWRAGFWSVSMCSF